MVFLGQDGPLKINLDELQQRLERPDYAPVAESLRDIEVASSMDLMTTFIAQRSDLAHWLEGAELNRDRDLRLQYLAGWGINSSLEDLLYRQLLSLRHPPRNLFEGSPQRVAWLLGALSSDGPVGQQP